MTTDLPFDPVLVTMTTDLPFDPVLVTKTTDLPFDPVLVTMTTDLPYDPVLVTMTTDLPYDPVLVIVQLLRSYVQWGPRNYEKCKMFRLIHIIMMSLDKFRFVAQVATLGNFFY